MIRSVILFALACALAWPMAWFYDQPDLLQLIPVSAISLLILAVQPTRIDTASRHMVLGRLTMIELASQFLSVALMLVLAWATGSVWAIVAGNVASAAIKVALAWLALPGITNRPRWESAAVSELVHYGKWIFLSTAASFLLTQSDKLILGRYLTMEGLGLYNIGFFLAGFPILMGHALIGRLMIPIYRENPPAHSPENFARLRRVRMALSGLMMALMVPVALGGVWLVDLLYDARYASSGVVVVMLAVALLPQILTLSYDQAALASGDSRGYFWLNGTRAGLLVVLMLLAVPLVGVAGAALAIGLTHLLCWPLGARLAHRHGAWDPVHDALMGGLAALLVLGAAILHWPMITVMLG
jgi:O-antigen/teichoic acid export membrane protein